jgi:ParB family transcriptional regulator, chromosome partitioning protein
MQIPDPNDLRRIPIHAIDADALTRDRTGVDAEAAAELEASILANGLRQPIEVYAFPDPVGTRGGPPLLYGLITGHRRLTAFRALHARTSAPDFAAIPAFLRAPASLEAALLAMVEENEVRAQLSPWERGAFAVSARDQGVFATIEEAVDKLFPTANRQKRARLRQIAWVVDEFGDVLAAPEQLTLRNVLRLADASRLGFGDVIRAALEGGGPTARAAQWELIEPILREAEARGTEAPTAPGRPRRVSAPRPHLTIRRERTRTGYSLHFTGRAATSPLIDSVFEEIERIFTPR